MSSWWANLLLSGWRVRAVAPFYGARKGAVSALSHVLDSSPRFVPFLHVLLAQRKQAWQYSAVNFTC